MFASSKYGYMTNATAVQISVVASGPAHSAPSEPAAGAVCEVASARARCDCARLVRERDRDDVEAACACERASVVVEGRSQARQPRRFGAPTITAWRCASARIRAALRAADGPSSVTVSAPSDSASRSRSMRRLRSRSTGAASPASRRTPPSTRASSASAMRLPARTSCSACSSGPTATSTRSRASQAREVRSADQRRARRGFDAIRHAPQRELAQRDQIGLAEEALDRGARLLRHVDLARLAAARADRPAADRSARPRPPRRRCGRAGSRAGARR